MNLTIPSKILLDALTAILGCTDKSGKALLRATDGVLEVVAADGENTLSVRAPADIIEPGAIIINARHFTSIAKALPSGTVFLTTDDKFKVSVECPPASFKVHGENSDNGVAMPTLETHGTFIPAAIHRVIEQVLFGIPVEDNRYGLGGGHFENAEDVFRIVTTDGSRLQYAECAFSGTLAVPNKMLISRRTLQEIRKLPAPLSIGFADRAIVIQSKDATLHARLVDGEFPPYRRVLPDGVPKRTVLTDRVKLIEALRRVALEAQDKASTVKVVFDRDELTAYARSVEHGEASHPVPVEMTGEPITMGFNVVFLLDALAAIETEQVRITLDEALSPCLIRPVEGDTSLFVVMPIRLE